MEINMSLLELTAVELAKEIKAGKTTAVEAMKAVLEQIEKTEETYHCYITIDKEKAMQAAKEVQEKIEAGTLTGLTYIYLLLPILAKAL